MEGKPRTYLALIRENPNFRKMFLALAISLAGDWFCLMAVLTVIKELQGAVSPQAISWVFILKMLPFALFAPIAGMCADRFPRKLVMVWSDLARAITILMLLFAPAASLWFVIGIVILQSSLGTFFEPARNALMPQILDKKDLPAANALTAMLWSTMIIVGMGAGGVVTEFFGWQVAVVLDVVSYLISAALVVSMSVSDHRAAHPTTEAGDNERVKFSALVPFFKANKHLLPYTFAKGLYGVGGAIQLLATYYGQEVFSLGESGALGLSIIMMARGFGALLGPFVVRHFAAGRITIFTAWMTASYFGAGLFYLLFSLSSTISVAAFCIALAHFFGATIWTSSTIILQTLTDNKYMGRVNAVEMGVFTLTSTFSLYLFGWLMEGEQLGAVHAGVLLGSVIMITGVVFYYFSRSIAAATSSSRRSV